MQCPPENGKAPSVNCSTDLYPRLLSYMGFRVKLGFFSF